MAPALTAVLALDAWPRSSSACYSFILVLARVGWRAADASVARTWLIEDKPHDAQGCCQHGIGPAQLDVLMHLARHSSICSGGLEPFRCSGLGGVGTPILGVTFFSGPGPWGSRLGAGLVTNALRMAGVAPAELHLLPALPAPISF